MGKDVEEGEISDTASVEEISEEVFNNNQEVVVIKETKPKEAARVWTMRDLYNKYPSMCRRYTSAGLYNLAWAQAVQNKPLNDIFVMEVEQDDLSKRSSPSSSVASVNSSREDKKEVDKIVIVDSGDEKEEGELEEGEIDLDSESSEKAFEQSDLINGGDSSKEKKLESIREALESVVDVIDSEKSFRGVCLKLENTLQSLREVFLENNIPRKDALIQLSFSAVQAINSVFSSMNNDLKEKNKDILSRLLSLLKSYDPPLFLPEQMREIGVMASSLDSLNVLLGARTSCKEKEMQIIDGVNERDSSVFAENVGHDLTHKNKFPLPVESLMHNKPYTSLEALKPGVSGFKSRGVLLPLLDLHKDHDADSLPSPTRETTSCIPTRRASTVGDGMIKSGSATAKVASDSEDFKMHYDETDALRAVSSYQQKFGHSSFFSNELPSPTPSEESGDGDGDTAGEISSSSTIDKSKLVNQPILGQETVSSKPMDFSSLHGLPTAKNAASNSGSSPVVKSSLKSRDPRLRFNNSDGLDLNQRASPMVQKAAKVEPIEGVLSSRKQKNMEEFLFAGPALKRQRNGMENSGVPRDAKAVYGGGGRLEDNDVVGPQITNRNQLSESSESFPRKLNNGATSPSVTFGPSTVVVSGNESVPVTVPSTTASLPALLKDIAVNPTMLINILKMGQQQKLEAEAQQISSKSPDSFTNTIHAPSLSLIRGAAPVDNVTPSMPSGVLPKPIGPVQLPSQAASTDELGKVRMKPRDPRRVLHGNTLQRSGSLASEQVKTEGSSTSSIHGSKGNLTLHRQQGQEDAKPMYSQSVTVPDITRQFTENLINIADIISVSQAVTNQPLVSQNLPSQPGQIKSNQLMVSQNLPSQPAQIKLGRADGKAVVSNHADQQTGTVSAPEVGTGPVPHSQNTWGDVEHLFERYDDHQKAAIQRERARRIEEQKKMFAARKLCLVLDLDHTLLNSAKFNEVDPVHDEILRKKEDQDREKPQRHLFRFPHMGMWTKLRPGIWNFLERASKLFELHLYTMGNKLYATEMAKVLDPKGVLFAGRVISRGDDGDPFDSDERVPKSKDLEGVLGLESGVVIVDDSVRVWPHNKLNLIVVERYIYFPCSRRQFGLPGPSLLEIDHDERPEDGTLASSLAVIERIHQNFFSHQTLDDVDVRNILASEQRKILAGCRIVFSRVFPIGEANPHLHPLWQTAEQFGATCTTQLDEQVTHVVANCLGTDKVNWALSTGKHVVHPNWVEASALLYRRANEYDFAIKQP